jgi:iron complex transport system substrate-binding protein
MRRPALRIAAAAAAVAATLALAACASGSGGASSDTGSASGPFSYTDALKKTVKLDAAPKVVVAQSSVAAALWDAGFEVSGAYGELTPGADGKLSYQAGSLDLTKVKVIGSTYGEFDTEKYALLNPELLIDYTFDDKSLWYVPQAQAQQVASLAPEIAVPGNYSGTDEAIETMVDLAGKLGADVKSAALAKEKAAYEAALASVATAAKSSGLKVAVMSPSADSLYIANPKYLPELETLTKDGLDVMTPVNADTQVFTQASWEQASDYAGADVILVDARTYDAAKADLAKVPTWANLPAVKAGQVYPWYAAAPYSYKAYAKIFQQIADELQKAKKL